MLGMFLVIVEQIIKNATMWHTVWQVFEYIIE